MGLRDKLKRLERQARGGMDWLDLRDGTRFFYEPEAVWMEIFRHGSDCLRADYAGEPRPEPPEILLAVARAKDRRGAVEKLYVPGSHPFLACDTEALIERGEFVPRSFLAGHSYSESLEVLAKKNKGGEDRP